MNDKHDTAPQSDHLAETFPLGTVLACLTGLTAVVAGLLVWMAPMLFTVDDARLAVLVGAFTAYGATVISLVPVAVVARYGVMALVGGYFAGAAVRVVGCIAVIAAAMALWGLPAGPLVLGLALYVPLLFLETGFIGRHLWRKDNPAAMTESSPR